MGQKNKRPRRWARRGARPRAPHDQRTEGACLFGALCPARANGDGRVMPWCDTHAMVEPLMPIGQQVEAGAHALLILDRAGGQSSPKWAVPDNITLVPRPPRAPEVNPVENVWPFIRDTWLSTLVFKTCDDIAAHCCQAWNTLMHQPGRVISIGGREGDHRVGALSDGMSMNGYCLGLRRKSDVNQHQRLRAELLPFSIHRGRSRRPQQKGLLSLGDLQWP